MLDITLIVALVAGLISFISPCVLPIIPGFLAYLSGTSLEGEQAEKGRWQMFLNSLFFVIGFSVVFALVGVLLNSVLSGVAYTAQAWFARIGGAIVIFFGLFLMKVIRIPFLERDHKIAVKKKFNSRYLTSFVFGSAFAVGWTPCVGAALGAILGLAATNPGQAFPLLMSYALGLGLPFLLVGLFATRAQGWINRNAHKLTIVNQIFGFILVALGVLIFTQQLARIASFGFLNNLLLN